LCSSIYLARNIRECQQRLTTEIVQSFLLTNQSNIYDNDLDNDEPVSYSYEKKKKLFCYINNSIRCVYFVEIQLVDFDVNIVVNDQMENNFHI
jgi:hypothetical protein